MKTTTILFALVLIAFTQVKSQIITNSTPNSQPTQNNTSSGSSVSSGYVTLNGGISLPIGGYASTGSNSSFNGYAQSGYTFNLSAAYPIAHSDFGIAAKIQYANNADNAGLISTNSGETYSGGNYSEVGGLAGLFITIPCNKFSFDFTLLGGFMSFTEASASITYNGVYYNSTDNTVDEYSVSGASSASNSVGLALNGGLAVRYNITKNVCVIINGDFLYSNQTINSTVTGTENEYYSSGLLYNTYSISTPSSYKAQIETINVTAGIGIAL